VFAFLVLAVAWLEFEGRRVRAPQTVAESLGLPVLGTLPAVPLPGAVVPAGTPSLRDLTSQAHLAEAADVVRTLVLQKAGDGPAVLLVAGARGRDGSTSVACQLALSLARGWRRTLLVDGHLRQPAVHAQFGLPVDPGLSEVLRGEIESADAIHPTRVSRLWLLPAGHWDNHALQALAQEREGFVFEALKEQYDTVVIDAGPVLPLADALLLARHADAALLAVLCDRSQLPAVHEARQRLEALGVPILGAFSGSRH
jgi:capsular exopolysaccharide synthesis family protein